MGARYAARMILTHLSVLSAPLPNCDRRALSQAWYSALHAHRNDEAALTRTRPAMSPCRSRRFPATGSEKTVAARAVRAGGIAAQSARGASEKFPERRAARSALARRIVQRFLRARAPLKSAAFTLVEGGRVRVMLRGGESCWRIVAICPAASAAAVKTALAQARFELAARGIALATCVKALPR